MRAASASHALPDMPPGALWTRLLTIERWPAWADPVVTRAAPGAASGVWRLSGALGRHEMRRARPILWSEMRRARPVRVRGEDFEVGIS